MNASASLATILSSLNGYGTSILTIIGTVLVIGVSYLIYRIGWGHVKRSLDTGYFHGNPGGKGMTRYKDQNWGRIKYELQEKGMTRF